MDIEKVELMHECVDKYLQMGTARMKDEETAEEGKQKRVKMERSKVGTKIRPKGLAIT